MYIKCYLYFIDLFSCKIISDDIAIASSRCYLDTLAQMQARDTGCININVIVAVVVVTIYIY